MRTTGLKPIAVFEASKGVLALLVAFGIHELAGDNLQQLAESLVTHLHLNLASHLPSIFLHASSALNDSRLGLIAAGALMYSLIRAIEAWGLWHAVRWTEWFALFSGAIYLPAELYELVTQPNLLSAGLLSINLIIVLYLYRTLKVQRADHSTSAQ
ncbi:MAG: DUF2127 domain-containing protein [Pseudomonadaceae bacterium]